jgi:hypothetical protein
MHVIGKNTDTRTCSNTSKTLSFVHPKSVLVPSASASGVLGALGFSRHKVLIKM